MRETAIGLIAAERMRQIEKEGWVAEHDDEHSEGQLSDAAACYAMSEGHRSKYASYNVLHGKPFPRWWPWEFAWWKPTPDDRIKELVKAGALIVAEIERLQRLRNDLISNK